MSKDPAPPDECAQCGATVPPRARACPGCGADERTGWREQSVYDGLDLPDSDESGLNPASPPSRPRPRDRLAWYWVLTIITVLLLLIVSALGLR
jgi:hypothetical protein